MKPRSDAKLLNLPDEQQAEIADWLLAGLPYHAAIPKVLDKFGVATSLRALSQFYQAVCVPHLLRRRREAVSAVEQIGEEMAREPGTWDAATIDAIKQKAFELSISPQTDPKDIKSIFMLLTKVRDQDIKREQLDLAKDKWKAECERLQAEKEATRRALESNLKTEGRGLTEDQVAKFRKELGLW